MVTTQNDLIRAPSIPLLKDFIEIIHASAAPTASWEEIVIAAGFKKSRWDDPGGGTNYHLNIKKGKISIGVRGNLYSASYQDLGRNISWNLLCIRGTPYIFLPKKDEELKSVFAQFVVDKLVDWVINTQLHTPQPRAKRGVKPGNFIEMRDKIDKLLLLRGKNRQDDYGNRYGFNFVEHIVTFGISKEDAIRLYRTSPDKMTPHEVHIISECNNARCEYEGDHPYLNYWHFMLDQLPDLENDIRMMINFQNILDAAEEDWQKEIAQMYVDEFGGGDQVVNVSW